MPVTDIVEQGMATRRRVLGDAHVDRAEAAKSPLDQPFQELITDAAWGRVWSRDTISKRERSMLTIALLAGLGNDHELAMHIRATARTGASRQDVLEALLHVAIYAGVPCANTAFARATAILRELGHELAPLPAADSFHPGAGRSRGGGRSLELGARTPVAAGRARDHPPEPDAAGRGLPDRQPSRRRPRHRGRAGRRPSGSRRCAARRACPG